MATVSTPHVVLLLEARYRSQLQPGALLEALRRRGAQVSEVVAEEETFEAADAGWLSHADVVVARGRSQALLSLLGWAEDRGVPTLNRRAAIESVVDKFALAVRLAANGVSTPRTYRGALASLTEVVPAASYPIIVKPVAGDNCRHVTVAQTREDLRRINWPEPVALAQRFLPNDGWDLKIYVAGGEVWAARKPSPLLPLPGRLAERVPCDAEMESVARRCRAIFGLEFFGVDCLATPAGLIVLEVNDFPNYSGIAEAGEVLASHVLLAVERRRKVERGPTPWEASA